MVTLRVFYLEISEWCMVARVLLGKASSWLRHRRSLHHLVLQRLAVRTGQIRLVILQWLSLKLIRIFGAVRISLVVWLLLVPPVLFIEICKQLLACAGVQERASWITYTFINRCQVTIQIPAPINAFLVERWTQIVEVVLLGLNVQQRDSSLAKIFFFSSFGGGSSALWSDHVLQHPLLESVSDVEDLAKAAVGGVLVRRIVHDLHELV